MVAQRTSKWQKVRCPNRPGEALVQIAAAGGNIIDIGVRTGMTWLDLTPAFALGVEGARDLNLWRFRPRIQAPSCSGTGVEGIRLSGW